MLIRRLNIRWRLTLWFGAAMIVLLVGRSFWIYFMMERHMIMTTDADLDSNLDSLEVEIGRISAADELERVLTNYANNNRGLRFDVATSNNDTLFRSPETPPPVTNKFRSAAAPKLERTYSTNLSETGEQRRAVIGAIASPVGNLTVRASRSMQAERNEAQNFIVTLLATLPPVALAALGVGYLVSARALSPVDKMISAANDITANRLEKRIDVPDTGDELSRLAKTLNEMIDRLYKSFEEMRRFTADAAHDLRTPVTALRTEIEVSLMADHTVEEFRSSMQTALDEAINLSRLTEQLLDLSREDDGTHPGLLETLRLDQIVGSVLEDLQTVARQKQITVDTQQMRPWTVTGDQVRLRRVVMNLFDNAVQYTPAGGRVWIEGQATPEQTTLVIADNGPGIPADDLPHIFDRFRRVDWARNRQSGGTGLGLAICKSIVEAHGGQIRAESTLGKGTRVIVTLPTAKAIA